MVNFLIIFNIIYFIFSNWNLSYIIILHLILLFYYTVFTFFIKKVNSNYSLLFLLVYLFWGVNILI